MDFLILILSGTVVGIIGIMLGGSMFFSIPIIQLIFPEVSYGMVIGNIKIGSFFRGIGSTFSTCNEIDWKNYLLISVPIFLGTIVGITAIKDIHQKWILPAIIIAVILAEITPKIASKIENKHFFILSITTGIYAGFIGPGIGIIIVAILRIKYCWDDDIIHVKIQARFVEWVIVIVSVIAHFLYGNTDTKIWFPWSIGTLLGGYIGGIILNKLGNISGKVQKRILRVSFLLAIIIAIKNAI